MKSRINNEVKEIKQLFKYFKETKNKCQRIMETLNCTNFNLQKFQQLEKLFIIDLHLLPLDHLTSRKNKLTIAIDEIMKIESSLSLKKIREKEKKIDQQQFKKKQSQSPVLNSPKKREQNIFTLDNQVNQKSQKLSGIIPSPVKSRLKIPYSKTIINQQDESDVQNNANPELTKYMFDQFSLLNIWNKNRGNLQQASHDKLDRLSKIVGILKRNINTLTQNQKMISKDQKINNHPQFCRCREQLQRYKMRSQQLQIYINKLKDENQNLKKQILNIKKLTPSQISRDKITRDRPKNITQNSQILFKGENFNIVKILNTKIKETKHLSLQKKKSNLVQNQKYSNLLKYIFLLQENIVEKLDFKKMVDSKNIRNSINQNKSIVQVPQSIKSQPKIQIVKVPQNIRSLNKISIDQQTSKNANDEMSLSQVGQKLTELRKQRKKIFEDDDLWKEVEKMKL